MKHELSSTIVSRFIGLKLSACVYCHPLLAKTSLTKQKYNLVQHQVLILTAFVYYVFQAPATTYLFIAIASELGC